MALEFPGSLHVSAAAEQYKVPHQLLRKLVREGVFTRIRYTSAETDTGPLYLRIAELDAWQTGGVDAVRKLRERESKQELVATHDLGGEG